MKFRVHPDDDREFIRVALISGHTLHLEKEQGWQEVHERFHGDLFKEGAECDERHVHVRPHTEQSEATAAGRLVTHDGHIRQALVTMIERRGSEEGEGDFTKDDLPNTNRVAQLAGLGVKKEDVLRVYRDMLTEAVAAADQKAAA